MALAGLSNQIRLLSPFQTKISPRKDLVFIGLLANDGELEPEWDANKTLLRFAGLSGIVA